MSLIDLKTLPADELDALLAFGRPLAFHIGSARVLAEFNRDGHALSVNLAYVEGGGEGVLLVLWKAVDAYAVKRGYEVVHWHVHALTCAKPNPRLLIFLRRRGFAEVDHPQYGPIFTQTTPVTAPGVRRPRLSSRRHPPG